MALRAVGENPPVDEYVLPLLKKAKSVYPEDADMLFLLKYHIVSVVDSIEATIQVFENEGKKVTG